METRRERLYRISGKAEDRYQRRDDAFWTRGGTSYFDGKLVSQADTLVARLTEARLSEPTKYRR